MGRVYSGLDVLSDFGGAFPWKSKYVDLGPGIRMAYVDEGPRTSPLTFLLLHGNPTWSFLYRRFIAHLSLRFRVIAVDHVGFGRSSKPRDPAYYALERHIQNLGAVLRQAKVDRVVPVVQDWGGPIGFGWATRNPGRVAGAVVLNTWAFIHDPSMRLPWLFRFLVLGRGGWKRAVNRNIFTELFLAKGGSARPLTRTEVDAYRSPHPAPEDRVGIARFPQLIPETHRPEHEAWGTMEKIEQGLVALRDKPALICWALKDPAFRKATLERWTRVFARVDGPHRLPKAKHYLQEDSAPEILARIDAWVAATFAAKAPRSTVAVAAR